MKKIILLSLVGLFLPHLSFAVPAETAGVPPSVINFEALRLYQAKKKLSHKKYDNGLRSWEFVPYEYTEDRLKYKNIDAHLKPQLPGVNYRKLCYHWKNCLKRIYKASNRYDQAYKKYSSNYLKKDKGVDLAYNSEKREDTSFLEGERSGYYKLWRWSFIEDRR